MPWPPQLVVFDTETDGVDTEGCHIVTAYVGLFDRATQTIVQSWDWLLNTGYDIPAGASAVHGISTEFMREWGTDPGEGVFQIMQRLDILQKQGLPFVVMNARYDFTLLDREAERHWPGIRAFEPAVVLDPFVLDKYVDPFRKGKRTLTALCAHLGIPVEANAHDAGADCLMAGRAASYMLSHGKLQPYSPEELHEQQKEWAAEQARGLAAYFRRVGKPTTGIQEAWPIVPRPTKKES